MNKILFDWEDVKIQFTEEQQKEIEHIIWMAKDTGEPQKIMFGDFDYGLVVWPSGKLSKTTKTIEEEILEEEGIEK